MKMSVRLAFGLVGTLALFSSALPMAFATDGWRDNVSLTGPGGDRFGVMTDRENNVAVCSLQDNRVNPRSIDLPSAKAVGSIEYAIRSSSPGNIGGFYGLKPGNKMSVLNDKTKLAKIGYLMSSRLAEVGRDNSKGAGFMLALQKVAGLSPYSSAWSFNGSGWDQARNFANTLVSDADAKAPFLANATASAKLNLKPGEATGTIGDVGVKSGSAWVPGLSYTVTLSGPVTFLDGTKSISGLTAANAKSLQIKATASGDAYATITVKNVPDTRVWVVKTEGKQDVLVPGKPRTLKANTETHPVQLGFHPVVRTNAKTSLQPDGSLADRVRVLPGAGEQWPYVNSVFVPVKVKVSVFTSPVKHPQSEVKPDDATLVESKEVVFQPKTFQEASEGALQVVSFAGPFKDATHYYFTADIDAAAQDAAWAKYFLAGFTAPHFEPIESGVVPMDLAVNTVAADSEVKVGSPLVDKAVVSSANGWVSDADVTLSFRAYGPFKDQPAQADTAPDSAPVAGEPAGLKVSGPGEYISGNNVIATAPGFYTFVATLTSENGFVASPVSHPFGMAAETVAVPGLKTSATDKLDGDKVLDTRGDVVINDAVSFGPIAHVGSEYSLKAQVIYKDGTGPVTCEGAPVVIEHVFTPESVYGVENVEVSVPGACLEEKPLVMFETLLKDGKELAIHADLNDEAQTLYPFKLGTRAFNLTDGSKFAALGDAKPVDEVHLKGTLPAGTSGLTLKTDLVNLETGKIITCEDKELTATNKVSDLLGKEAAGAVDAVVKVPFDVPKGCVVGASTVFYEYLMDGGKVLAKHEDNTDVSQQLFFPSLKTKAASADGAKVLDPAASVKLVDTVTHKGLMPGAKCKVSGTLMNVATGKEVLLAGKPVTAASEFVAKGGSEDVQVVFELNASSLAGAVVNPFEETVCDGVKVGEHKDLKDEAQNVRFTDGSGGDGNLPKTGADSVALFGVAGTLASMGAGLFVAARRKRHE